MRVPQPAEGQEGIIVKEVRCTFYLRKPLGGGYEYLLLHFPAYGNIGDFVTENPPLVGDLVPLRDTDGRFDGTVRVLDRQWGHNQYGSANWPITEPRPVQPDMLSIVVEEAEGIFRDEVARKEEEE